MSQTMRPRGVPATSTTKPAPAPAGEVVQRKAALRGQELGAQLAQLDPEQDPHAIAQRGVGGGGAALPHAERIQRAFGAHDLGGVRAHTGEHAAAASGAMGAQAYTRGDDVALGRGGSDLHTVAHEAAHVVQQRQGVSVAGGVGQAGDAYERQADEAADAVVAGRSAEPILGAPASSRAGAAPVVQHKLSYTKDTAYLDAAQNSKLSRFGVLTEMQAKCDKALGDSVNIDVVEAIVGGAAAAFQPGQKRVAIKPLPKDMESQKESLNGVEVTDRCITLSHELQHVFDAYDPDGSFDLRDALKSPTTDVWMQLVRSEWHAHARQAKAAKEQQDQERSPGMRHKGLLKAWTADTFDRKKSDPTDGMFKWTRDYISNYRYDNKKTATDDETEKFIQSKGAWVSEAFAILPAQG